MDKCGGKIHDFRNRQNQQQKRITSLDSWAYFSIQMKMNQITSAKQKNKTWDACVLDSIIKYIRHNSLADACLGLCVCLCLCVLRFYFQCIGFTAQNLWGNWAKSIAIHVVSAPIDFCFPEIFPIRKIYWCFYCAYQIGLLACVSVSMSMSHCPRFSIRNVSFVGIKSNHFYVFVRIHKSDTDEKYARCLKVETPFFF